MKQNAINVKTTIAVATSIARVFPYDPGHAAIGVP